LAGRQRVTALAINVYFHAGTIITYKSKIFCENRRGKSTNTSLNKERNKSYFRIKISDMPRVKKKYLILLAVASGLLLSAAWPLRGFPFLSLIALIPLLFILEQIRKEPDRFRWMASFRYTYLAVFIWNLLTTWWIWYSTEIGAIFAVIFNSMIMALVVQLAVFARTKINPAKGGHIILPVFWLAFEFAHRSWELSWSWLDLGNVFATRIEFIQWYEYTGTQGGTLWIWIINILLFEIIKGIFFTSLIKKTRNWLAGITLFFLIVPITISLVRFYTYEEKSNPVDIVVIQPNIDPWEEEFSLSIPEVLDRMLTRAKDIADTNVDFYVAPESVIQEGMYEDEFEYSRSLAGIRDFLRLYSPEAKFVAGAGTFHMFKPGEDIPPSARQYNNTELYYEAYNTALFFDVNEKVQSYHKSKLVPGVEHMPFGGLIKPIEEYAIDLGGTTGTLGRSPERTVFYGGIVPVSPVICYESIYGEFVSGFVKNGAEIIMIITNDGWWKNTAGHRQHLAYASLRAIETRRSIARSANTGVSCFVNQKGEQFLQTKYWEPDVIRMEINANDCITFYVKYGDYLGRSAAMASILLLLIGVVRHFMRKYTKFEVVE